MTSEKKQEVCCEKCYIPAHDELMPPDYMLSDNLPEGCSNDYCACHHLAPVGEGEGWRIQLAVFCEQKKLDFQTRAELTYFVEAMREEAREEGRKPRGMDGAIEAVKMMAEYQQGRKQGVEDVLEAIRELVAARKSH